MKATCMVECYTWFVCVCASVHALFSSVCLCVCECVCVCVCESVCVCVCVYVHACTHMRAHMRMYRKRFWFLSTAVCTLTVCYLLFLVLMFQRPSHPTSPSPPPPFPSSTPIPPYRGMEGTRVGIWVAHGEGRALFPSPDMLSTVLSSNLAPIRYCDDEGKPTEAYPFNPNGSPAGIAALCSPDGRHLAMMPHPERCFLSWQMPWVSGEVQAAMPKSGPSPWLKIFQNARDWCSEHDAE